MASSRIAIGIDVGGSGIKAAVVDVESGRVPVGADPRSPTPSPVDADAVSPRSPGSSSGWQVERAR
jgi:polyphosphate glucokinase